MLRFSLLLLLLPTIALADTQVPPGCYELAVREGFPTDTLNKRQEIKARARMAYLKLRTPNDELVIRCRLAIEALRK